MKEPFSKSRPEDFSGILKRGGKDDNMELVKPKVGDYVTIRMNDPKEHKYGSRFVEGVVVRENKDGTVTIRDIKNNEEKTGEDPAIKPADLIPKNLRADLEKVRRELGV